MQKDKNLNLIQKLLFLMYLLINQKYTAKEIISAFLKINIKISRASLNNYIDILKNNGINIKTEKSKKENLYYILLKPFELNMNDKIDLVFRELKKIIISKKQYHTIKNALYLFYKLSKNFDDNSSKKIANFGYFSTLNWFLINDLEKHCFDKDIIQIEYILPDGKNKDITIHADKLMVYGSSNRLYLSGTLGESFLFSRLPVDRIFMIKQVLRKKARFDLSVRLLEYTVSKKDFDKLGLLENEIISNQNDDKITILSPITDEFLISQRLMEYCPNVYYISDKKIKDTVIEKLKTLEKIYEE